MQGAAQISRRRFLRYIVGGLGVSLLAACGGGGATPTSGAQQAPATAAKPSPTAAMASPTTASTATAAGGAATAAASPTAGAVAFNPSACYKPWPGTSEMFTWKKKNGPYRIALSNSYIGNVWRTEMIKIAKAYVNLPDIKKNVSEFYVNSSGNDAAAQIAQIQNMIASKYDAIIINAASPTALNPVVEQAIQAGILVISFDNTVTSNKAVAVNEDQVEFGRVMADWLAKQLNGKGNVLVVRGVAGTTVDQQRTQGMKEVFSKYPDIKIVAEVYGNWDPGTAQQVTAQALAANPQIDGVWCQGGTDGVVRAFLQAGRKLVPVAGEAENGFRKQLLQYRNQGLVGISVGQSPSLVAVSIHVAIDLLSGQQVPRQIAVPLPIATSDDLKPGVNVFPDLPDNFFTPIQLPDCGVTLTYDDIKDVQV